MFHIFFPWGPRLVILVHLKSDILVAMKGPQQAVLSLMDFYMTLLPAMWHFPIPHARNIPGLFSPGQASLILFFVVGAFAVVRCHVMSCAKSVCWVFCGAVMTQKQLLASLAFATDFTSNQENDMLSWEFLRPVQPWHYGRPVAPLSFDHFTQRFFQTFSDALPSSSVIFPHLPVSMLCTFADCGCRPLHRFTLMLGTRACVWKLPGGGAVDAVSPVLLPRPNPMQRKNTCEQTKVMWYGCGTI